MHAPQDLSSNRPTVDRSDHPILQDIDGANTLVELFLKRAEQHGPSPFLGRKVAGTWETISWSDVADQVCLLAESLRAIGLSQGDRVALVSENRPEWCIADLAIMAAGCVSVPTYITTTERDHAHILDNSGARAVIVSTEKLLGPVVGAISRTGIVDHVIGIEDLHRKQASAFSYHDWSSMTKGDADAARASVKERMATLSREDTACLIYTSGTGGAPRGVKQHQPVQYCGRGRDRHHRLWRRQ